MCPVVTLAHHEVLHKVNNIKGLQHYIHKTKEEHNSVSDFSIVTHVFRSNPIILLQFHDTREKLADITSSIISTINSRCQCSLTVNQISAANLLCTSDRQVVLYRAELSGRSDCAQVLLYIEQWVSGSQRSIVVQGSITEVYPSCPIEVDSLMAQTECVRPTTIGPVTESVEITAVGGAVKGAVGGGVGGGVGGAVGGVVLIGIIVLGAVVYVCMYKNKHR